MITLYVLALLAGLALVALAFRLLRRPVAPRLPPCAACGQRPAEFCDLCPACEEVQHQLTRRGHIADAWSGATLARVREAVTRPVQPDVRPAPPATCPNCGSAVAEDAACALCRAEASL